MKLVRVRLIRGARTRVYSPRHALSLPRMVEQADLRVAEWSRLPSTRESSTHTGEIAATLSAVGVDTRPNHAVAVAAPATQFPEADLPVRPLYTLGGVAGGRYIISVRALLLPIPEIIRRDRSRRVRGIEEGAHRPSSVYALALPGPEAFASGTCIVCEKEFTSDGTPQGPVPCGRSCGGKLHSHASGGTGRLGLPSLADLSCTCGKATRGSSLVLCKCYLNEGNPQGPCCARLECWETSTFLRKYLRCPQKRSGGHFWPGCSTPTVSLSQAGTSPVCCDRANVLPATTSRADPFSLCYPRNSNDEACERPHRG